MEIVIGHDDVMDAIKNYAKKRVSLAPSEKLEVELIRSLKPLSYSARITISKEQGSPVTLEEPEAVLVKTEEVKEPTMESVDTALTSESDSLLFKASKEPGE